MGSRRQQGSPPVPPLSFEAFDPTIRSDAEIALTARQIDYFLMGDIKNFYTAPRGERPTALLSSEISSGPNFTIGGLGLKYIDTDPLSLADRESRLRESGQVQNTGIEYFLAYAEGEDRNPDDALKGLLLLTKAARCISGKHHPLEIAELDIHSRFRGQGYGKVAMGLAAERAHPDDEMQLDVALTNYGAQAFYEKLGFTFTSRQVEYHQVYNIGHQQMVARPGNVLAALAKA